MRIYPHHRSVWTPFAKWMRLQVAFSANKMLVSCHHPTIPPLVLLKVCYIFLKSMIIPSIIPDKIKTADIHWDTKLSPRIPGYCFSDFLRVKLRATIQGRYWKNIARNIASSIVRNLSTMLALPITNTKQYWTNGSLTSSARSYLIHQKDHGIAFRIRGIE